MRSLCFFTCSSSSPKACLQQALRCAALPVACSIPEGRTRFSEYIFSAKLVLPSGTMHATGSAAHLSACCKQAFGELEEQVKKHKERIRKDYEWKRKRPRVRAEALT